MATCSTSSSGGGGAKAEKVAESYHVFPDTATDSHSFPGSGKETADFFKENSNHYELMNKADADTKEAFDRYTTGWMMGSEIWTEGFGGLESREQARQRSLDKTIDQATLKTGITVTRLSDAQLILGKGKKMPTLEQLQAMEGQNIFSAGNMSTSAASTGLTIGSGSKRVEYKINIPGGTVGAGMWVGAKRINPTWGAQQREYITNRDTWWKVGKTTYDSKRNIYQVELTYQALDAHDYGSRAR